MEAAERVEYKTMATSSQDSGMFVEIHTGWRLSESRLERVLRPNSYTFPFGWIFTMAMAYFCS